MAVVQLRFNATDFKHDIREILDRKVGAIKKDEQLYISLLEEFYAYIMPPGPYDTGAFVDAAHGESKDHHYRQGFIAISSHHGIERDAKDVNPNTGYVKSYFAPLYAKTTGIHLEDGETLTGAVIYEQMDPGLKKAFLMDAGQLIAECMNEH